MITRLKIAATAIAFAAVGVLAGTMIDSPAEQPSCPTEDSCKIDYRDGQWIITPDVP
jgi:hypothetical protein